MTLRQNMKYWLPVILWMGFIFLMSTDTFSAQNTSRVVEPILRFLFPSITAKHLMLAHEIIRKSAHVTEYFISGLLLFRAFRDDATEPRIWRWALLSLLITFLIAASDEFHQTFISSRTPSPIDVGIDTAGGFFAQCINVLRAKRSFRPVKTQPGA